MHTCTFLCSVPGRFSCAHTFPYITADSNINCLTLLLHCTYFHYKSETKQQYVLICHERLIAALVECVPSNTEVGLSTHGGMYTLCF